MIENINPLYHNSVRSRTAAGAMETRHEIKLFTIQG